MSVSISLFAGAGWQFFDNNGVPLAGGLIYTYAAGTTTPLTTYTTSAGNIANTNPIVLDSAGRTANETWLTVGSSYKFILKTSTGTQIGSYDNILGANDFTAVYAALAASSGASLIGYIQSVSAVAETVQTKLRESVSVKDFGAVGDGTTNDTAAIQAAQNYIVSTGIPNVLLFPAGTYKCTTGLTINCGYVSCTGNRAVLDFSTLGNSAAVTFIGGNPSSGNPYNQTNCVFQGFKIIGPSTSIAAGLYFYTTSEPGPAHMIVKDCNISNFNNGITFFSNAYVLTFDHVDVWQCYRGIFSQTGATNSGENIRFLNCTIYNILTEGLRNDNGGADLNFYGTSFDGFTTAAVITAGQVSFTGCHFETGYDSSALNISSNSIVTCTACYFLNSYATQNNYIINNGYLSIFGGRISASDTATNVVYSTSRLTIVGTHFQTASATKYTIGSGNYYVYLPNGSTVETNASVVTTAAVQAALFTSTNTTTLTVLSTYVSLGVASRGGLFAFRDSTLGGTALFMADTTGGANSVYNGITGFAMTYTGGQMSIQVTSSTVPRIINWNFLQTNAG